MHRSQGYTTAPWDGEDISFVFTPPPSKYCTKICVESNLMEKNSQT